MEPYYGFEYFCGANILVRIGDMPILEATNIAYSINESKRPIYGYSSRFFDAMARGQVLVQGQLVINYVHEDYLFHAMASGINRAVRGEEASPEFLSNAQLNEELDSLTNLDDEIVKQLKERFWLSGTDSPFTRLNNTRNPHDEIGGVNIAITFGDQDLGGKQNGRTGKLLHNVHFLGRSQVITISEDVIVESYSFIARNIASLRNIEKITTIDSNTTIVPPEDEPGE